MRPLRDDIGPQRRQGRYVLGDLLGRGGMAEVFAGHAIGSHGFQKPVAIKRLLPSLANDHVFVERLISEAKLLVGMAHGNLVSVLDLARDGDDVFLVMEYVDGPSLRQLLKARGQRGLPLAIASYIIQSAAAGLEFAHARPGGAVIHADISPSNVLLTSSGEVRVADFGIARREGGGGGIVEGKWAYMAPEQARGEALTPACDVFALGVVLYELITGQHPLGRQVSAGARESASLHVVPPRVVRPAIPPRLEAICMKALAHDPSERYARMQPLIDDIVEERFANGWKEGANDLAQAIKEIAAGPFEAAQLRTQVMDRPMTLFTRSLIGTSMSSPLIDAAAGTQPSRTLLSAPIAPPIDVREPRGHRWTWAVLGIAVVVGVIAAVAIQLAPDEEAQRIARAQQQTAARASPPTPPPPVAAPAPVADAVAPPATNSAVTPPTSKAARRPKSAAVAAHRGAEATLLVRTTGTWAFVYVDGKQAETPAAKFRLAPGTYHVRLKNQEQHLSHDCTVTLEPGQVAKLVVELEEEGACSLE